MNNLRLIRKSTGLTMKKVAEVINVSESAISMYETGKRQPDNDILLSLANYFNVTTDYLLGREVASSKNKAVIMAKGFGKVEYELSEENLKLAHQLIAKMAEQDKNK